MRTGATQNLSLMGFRNTSPNPVVFFYNPNLITMKSVLRWTLILLPILVMSCDESTNEPIVNEPPDNDSGIKLCYVSHMSIVEHNFGTNSIRTNKKITYDGKNISDVDFLWVNNQVENSIHYSYSPGSMVGDHHLRSNRSKRYSYGFIDSVMLYRSLSMRYDDDDTYYHNYTYNYEYDDDGFLSTIAYVQGGPPWDEVFQITWDEAHKNIIAMKSPEKEVYLTYDNKLNPFFARPSADYYYLNYWSISTLSNLLLPFNNNNIKQMRWYTPHASSESWIDLEYTYDKSNRPLAMMARIKRPDDPVFGSIVAESTFKYQD